ncbi:hypothetical protein TcBrA4_0111240 [Trypanosoma cruzi]|nr:hypothetical protein TcBrA4_0111240 [Trypanosoma cruzi]
MFSLWRYIVQQPAYSHAHREQSALSLKIGFRHLIPPRPEKSQSPTQTPVATNTLSAIEALRAAPLAVRDCVAEEIWAMLLSLVKRGHPAHLIFPPSHCGAPRNEAADKEATIARSLQQCCIPIWHVEFLAAVKVLYWKEFQEEEEVAHTARQALVGVARAVFLVCRQTSGIESRLRADTMRLLPTPR